MKSEIPNEINRLICGICFAEKEDVEFIAVNTLDQSVKYLCSNCEENFEDRFNFKITQFIDLDKEKLREKVNKLTKEIRNAKSEIDSKVSEKISDYFSILDDIPSKVFEEATKLIENIKQLIPDKKGNFAILQNYQNLIVRLENYSYQLDEINLNENFQAKLIKQFVKDNLKLIKDHFENNLKPFSKEYKKTDFRCFLDEEKFTKKISIDLDQTIEENLRNLEYNLNGLKFDCNVILLTAVQQICPGLNLHQELIRDDVVPQNLLNMKLNSNQNFMLINDWAKNYVKNSNNEYLSILSDDHGFVAPYSRKITNIDFVVTEALHRIFSHFLISIKPNTIMKKAIRGNFQLMFGNGMIRSFYANNNYLSEDTSKTINPITMTGNQFIKATVKLLDLSGDSFDTDVYLYDNNFVIMYDCQRSSCYFYHDPPHYQIISINEKTKNLLDYLKGKFTSNYVISNKNVIHNSYNNSTKGLKNNSKNPTQSNSAISQNDSSSLLKEKFIKILNNIFCNRAVHSINNINKGRVFGEFVAIDESQKTFEFYNWRNRAAYEVKACVKTNNSIGYKSFYFTLNNLKLIKPYEICEFLPNENEHEEDRYQIEFPYEFEEILNKFILCSSKHSNYSSSEHYQKIYNKINGLLDFEKMIIHKFSPSFECKYKGKFKDLEKNHAKTGSCYKIDMEFEYNGESMITTFLFEKYRNNNNEDDYKMIVPEYDEKVPSTLEVLDNREFMSFKSSSHEHIIKTLKKTNEVKINNIPQSSEKNILEEEVDTTKLSYEEESKKEEELRISEEIKSRLIEDEEKIKSRMENCERISFYNFKEPITLDNFEEKKLEIKGAIKIIMVNELNEVEEIKALKTFSGSLKILRKDGIIDEKIVENELLILAEVVNKQNKKTNMYFTSSGLNPIIELEDPDSEDIKVIDEESRNILSTMSNERIEKLKFTNNLFNNPSMIIKTFKDVHIIIDNSGSMGDKIEKSKNEIISKFGVSKSYEKIYNCNFSRNNELFNAMKKLIEQAEIGDALYFIADFADGHDNSSESAQEIESILNSKKMSLYLHSVNCDIYPYLRDVATNTGGWNIVYRHF